jgi:hypothetical protein
MLTDPRAETSGRKLAVVETNSIVPGARRSPNPASATEFAADLAWERAQEQAAIAYRAGDAITPTRLWAAALDIAGKHFGPGDPRLASSLTNNGLVLRRRRQDHQANRMFQDAVDVWDASWRWIHLMTQDRAADGVYGSDHLDIYDGNARAWFNALARQGRSATMALDCHGWLSAGGLDDWFDIKPQRMSDLRKLLGAVLLIAPRPRA